MPFGAAPPCAGNAKVIIRPRSCAPSAASHRRGTAPAATPVPTGARRTGTRVPSAAVGHDSAGRGRAHWRGGHPSVRAAPPGAARCPRCPGRAPLGARQLAYGLAAARVRVRRRRHPVRAEQRRGLGGLHRPARGGGAARAASAADHRLRARGGVRRDVDGRRPVARLHRRGGRARGGGRGPPGRRLARAGPTGSRGPSSRWSSRRTGRCCRRSSACSSAGWGGCCSARGSRAGRSSARRGGCVGRPAGSSSGPPSRASCTTSSGTRSPPWWCRPRPASWATRGRRWRPSGAWAAPR